MKPFIKYGVLLASVGVLAAYAAPPVLPWAGPPGRFVRPQAPPTVSSSTDYDTEYILNLYRDINYGGEMIELRIWVEPDGAEYILDGSILGDIGDKYWDKRISSLGPENTDAVGDWELFGNTYCRDFLMSGTGPRNDVDPCNDDTRSFRFRCKADDPGQGAAYFYIYEHEDQNGKCLPMRLYRTGNSNDVVLEISGLCGHWNNKISSIQTSDDGAGSYEWVFYNDKNYNDGNGGNLGLYDGDDDSDLRDNGLNDKLSSLRLYIHPDE